MKQKISQKQKEVIEDLDTQDSIFTKKYSGNVEIGDDIEDLFKNKVNKNDKKLYKEWRNKINFLITLYNDNSKMKIYQKV